jgi:AraC-like DNA-binding protein
MNPLESLNEAAVVESKTKRPNPATGWAPRACVWEGGWIGAGRANAVVPPHDHHAVQVSLSIDGRLRVREAEGDWKTTAGTVVLPDVPHSFDPGGAVAMLFVDPECREGRWLRQSWKDPVNAVPVERYESCLPGLRQLLERPLDVEETTELVRSVVRSLCIGPPPVRKIDDRVTKALQLIRESDASRIPLEDVAASVFLSPSRFAHLFSDAVGLPFRRYVLWRKLCRALQIVSGGATLSAAAHRSGFSDSAHLTRTFYQMFGISPTVMLGGGELYAMPSPFETPATEDG